MLLALAFSCRASPRYIQLRCSMLVKPSNGLTSCGREDCRYQTVENAGDSAQHHLSTESECVTLMLDPSPNRDLPYLRQLPNSLTNRPIQIRMPRHRKQDPRSQLQQPMLNSLNKSKQPPMWPGDLPTCAT